MRLKFLGAVVAGTLLFGFLVPGVGTSGVVGAQAPIANGPKPVAPPDWLAPSDGIKPPGPDAMTIRWLGVAGFEIRTARAAILIDPYFSRRPLWQLLAGPARPDMDRIRQGLRPAKAVFVGHAHFDHLLDAPEVSRLLGCPLYASDQALRVANAEGLPAAQQKPLAPGMQVTVGDMLIEAVASKHSDMPTQWLAGGDMPPKVTFPMGFLGYHNGPVYGFRIHWRGRTIYHSGSAQIVESALGNHKTDVVLMCLTGWTSSPHLFERVEKTLAPRVMIPMHDDDFFQPIARGFVENPLAHRREGLAAIHKAMPDASIVTLDFNQEVRLHAAEGVTGS